MKSITTSDSSLMDLNLKRIVKDDNFMNLFWKLSDGNESVRLEAGNSLIDYVIQDQKLNGSENEWSKTVTYAFGRLAQGLCSGHKSSRIGFSATLSALLKTLNVSTDSEVEKLIAIFHSKLKVIRNKPKDNKPDKEMLIGKVFFFVCLIRGVNFQNVEKFVEIIYKNLIELSKKKSYLKTPAFDGLIELVKKCSDDVFENKLWPKLSDLLSCGWEDVDPDTLLLLDTCHITHPQLCGSSYLVMNNWQASSKKNKKAKLFGPHSYLHLGKVLALSTKAHPQMHGVVQTVLNEVKSQDVNGITKFWKQVVEPSLLVQSAEKKFLALRISVDLLPHLDEAHVKSIWSTNLIMALFYALSNKSNSIHLLCKNQLSHELESALKTEGIKPDVQLQFLYILLSSPVGIRLDNLTNTPFIALTVRNLLLPALTKYIHWLKVFYTTGDAGSDVIKADNLNVIQNWCASQLFGVIRVEAFKDELDMQLSIVNFLLLFAFFIPKNKSILKETQNLDIEGKITDVANTVRKNTKQWFLKAFSALVQAKEDKKVVLDKHLVPVLNFCSEMLNSKTVEAVSPMSKEYEEEWNLINDDITSLSKMKHNEVNGNMAVIVSILMIYNGMIILSDNEEDKKDAKATSSELRIIVGEYFTGQEVDSREAGDRDWDAIVTEILLSKLARPSHANRMVVDQVFKILCPAVGKLAITLILDAIDPTTALQEEDDDMEDETSESDEEVDDDDSEEHDSAFSESEEEVDDQFKNLVNAALGPAAVMEEKESEDEEDETDLSDDAMMRLDPMLAEVFRQRAKKNDEKREVEKSQIDFKIRCLDLIETLATWKSNKNEGLKPHGHPLLLYGIPKLFTFAEHYSQKDDYKLLAEKLALLLKLKICQPKHIILNDTSDEEIFTNLESLMISSCNAHSQFFCRLASSCAAFIIHTLLGQPTIADAAKEKITKISLNVLKKFIEDENSLIMSEIFASFAEKFPKVAVDFIPPLLKYLKENIKQYKKQQVCTILTSCLKFNAHDLKNTALVPKVFEITFGIVKGVVDTQESCKIKFLSATLELLQIAAEIHEISDSKQIVETLKQFLELPSIKSKQTIVNKTWNILSKYESRHKQDGAEKRKRKMERQKARKEKQQRALDKQKQKLDDANNSEDEPVSKKKKNKKGKHQSKKTKEDDLTLKKIDNTKQVKKKSKKKKKAVNSTAV